MEEQINRFFCDSNSIGESEEMEPVEGYLEVVKAFSRVSYESVYIVDYLTRTFEYVSPNPIFLCGHTAEEVKEMGFRFYFERVQQSDVELLLNINEIGLAFYDNIPIAERKEYTISYDFNILNESGNYMLINHQLTPVFLTGQGKMWKSMCLVSLSSKDKSGNVTISRQNSAEIWNFNFGENRWKPGKKASFNGRERDILRLYAQGLTINEIAGKLSISGDTVKFHRKNMFSKAGVTSITEALSYAIQNKLI